MPAPKDKNKTFSALAAAHPGHREEVRKVIRVQAADRLKNRQNARIRANVHKTFESKLGEGLDKERTRALDPHMIRKNRVSAIANDLEFEKKRIKKLASAHRGKKRSSIFSALSKSSRINKLAFKRTSKKRLVNESILEGKLSDYAKKKATATKTYAGKHRGVIAGTALGVAGGAYLAHRARKRFEREVDKEVQMRKARYNQLVSEKEMDAMTRKDVIEALLGEGAPRVNLVRKPNLARRYGQLKVDARKGYEATKTKYKALTPEQKKKLGLKVGGGAAAALAVGFGTRHVLRKLRARRMRKRMERAQQQGASVRESIIEALLSFHV